MRILGCAAIGALIAGASLLPLTGLYAADPGLRTIVEKNFPDGNVAIGVAAHGAALDKDAGLAATVAREFSYVTPANDFKQSTVHPEPGAAWDWSLADRWMERIQKNQQVLRIHAPIGPQVSKWAKNDERKPGELAAALDEWIPALCKRYAGRPGVKWIDVVNETIDGEGEWMTSRPGVKAHKSPWLKLGMADVKERPSVPFYIARAFELAEQNCGNLKLIINQGTIDPPAAARLKELVTGLRARGLRVDGIGWQAHVQVGWEERRNRTKWLADLIDWAHANNLEFHITENTVYVPRGESELDAEAQAKTFATILGLLLERRERGFVGWNLWHARDDQTDNKERAGTLWDSKNQPKPAYFAIRKLLENPPKPVAK